MLDRQIAQDALSLAEDAAAVRHGRCKFLTCCYQYDGFHQLVSIYSETALVTQHGATWAQFPISNCSRPEASIVHLAARCRSAIV